MAAKLFGTKLEEKAWDLLNWLDDTGRVDPDSKWYYEVAHKIQMADDDKTVREAIKEIKEAIRKNCISCDDACNLAFDTYLVTGYWDRTSGNERRKVFKGYLCEQCMDTYLLPGYRIIKEGNQLAYYKEGQ
jgi:hypothetical protein